jgi:GTP-binding protein
MKKDLRNIAIIAHVDHGKTTLVDCLLRQAGAYREGQKVDDRAMDRGDLERERGITILSKCTSIDWKGTHINIVDTPGHVDFGGEVERVLKMVESALVVVDSVEGPMPQTRFVVKKALALGLMPILVINKIDRPQARCHEVLDEFFDLLVELHATDAQLDFPVIYASAKEGFARLDPKDDVHDVSALLDTVISRVAPPPGDPDAPFQMQVTTFDSTEHLGRIAIGRVARGRLNPGQDVGRLGRDGLSERGRVLRIFSFEGLGRADASACEAGEIVAIAGLKDCEVGDTLCDPRAPERLSALEIEPPTLSMEFTYNDGPLSGQDGKFVTAKHLEERLWREQRQNVGLIIEPTERPGSFLVSGRGVLHLSILVETMRREGYELCLGRPRVITQKSDDGIDLEPWEWVVIEVPEQYVGIVMERSANRGAQLKDMVPIDGNRTKMEYYCSTRGLIGLRSQLLTDTRGTVLMSHNLFEWRPKSGDIETRQRGVLIAKEPGQTTGYAIEGLQERGVMFVEPGLEVYAGQIVGLHSRSNDLVVNPCKKKHLTNMRASSKDATVVLDAKVDMDLEDCIEFVQDDEMVEVTPASIRLRKRILDHSRRQHAEK